MSGLVRRATLLTLGGALLAGAGTAGAPSVGPSSIPACIALVGRNGVTLDPAGQFRVTVRDDANNPVPFVDVYVDFAGCLPGGDNHVARQAEQTYPGITVVNLPPGTFQVHQTTNDVGVATFRILGSAGNTSNGGGTIPAAGARCARVYAGSPPVLLGGVTVNAYNEDYSVGASGVGGNDLSAWTGDFFSSSVIGDAGRSDFDCNGTISGNDLSFLVGVFFSNGSINGFTLPGAW